jgi:hypothetical protein
MTMGWSATAKSKKAKSSVVTMRGMISSNAQNVNRKRSRSAAAIMVIGVPSVTRRSQSVEEDQMKNMKLSTFIWVFLAGWWTSFLFNLLLTAIKQSN